MSNFLFISLGIKLFEIILPVSQKMYVFSELFVWKDGNRRQAIFRFI